MGRGELLHNANSDGTWRFLENIYIKSAKSKSQQASAARKRTQQNTPFSIAQGGKVIGYRCTEIAAPK
nr:unnamed protein product [Callosobruchus analis]